MPHAEGGMLCPDETLAVLVAMLQAGEEDATPKLHDLTARFRQDPRLHFLSGSMMAGQKDYEGARKAMRRAVDLAPDFAIARFQLGFLLLTNGEAWPAQEVWGPLHGLPESHYLRHFVRGLCHLVRDEFAGTIAELERGIAANQENLPLNNDMRLVIDEVREKGLIGGGHDTPGDMSSAQMLLQQASLRSTRH
jgi:hypothetical protein